MERDILVGRGQHARVLIVEEEPVSALILKRFLDQVGIRYDYATGGEQALSLFQRNRYRLVISDWLLPEISGIELCRQFRSEESHYVYFILCGSTSDKADLQVAYDAGIDDFLVKPLDSESLHQRLKVARRILQIENSLHAQAIEMESNSQALRTMNKSLFHASRRFEELFNGLPIACFTMDQAGLVHEWNRQSEKDFEIFTHEAFQRPVYEMFGSRSDGFWTKEVIDSVLSGELVESQDWCFKRDNGEERFFVCKMFGLCNDEGELIGVICANLNITERKFAEKRIDEQIVTINQYAKELQLQKAKLEKANRRLELLALTDGMTGLLNHRGFEEEMARAYDRHCRTGSFLSLVLIDVDHFKQYNDTFGHLGGDAVLQSFGQVLRQTTRRYEPAARYGGEEFAVILEGADRSQAVLAAERLRQAINKRRWPHRNITASFGVATTGEVSVDIEELIRRADVALYASKDRGRDCVTHYAEAAIQQVA